ncbi:MAG: fimbrillin family protein, partial [Muribaculaceae bacterium]|nr:fimbrillin family protein [Muribaculaceae bacterium]
MKMKNYNIYILQTIKALLLLVFVVSCSQDDFEQGMPLPAGQYPLDITVSVEGLQSRADGKDNWKEGDEIGVRIGSDAEIGRYTLNSDGSVNIDKSRNLLHWKNTAPASVKAWYPIEPQTNVSIANQSGLSDFSSIDYLTATAENQNYKNTVGLTFKHQMAKVRCVLKSADTDDISTKEVTNATVTFNGYTVASFDEGELTGSAFGKIVPVKSNLTHEALLVPANMTGKELFRIDIKVGGYDKTFSYTPSGEYANLQQGTSYVFNVTLSRDKMVVSKISASWDGDEENLFPKSIPLQLYLPEEFFEFRDYGVPNCESDNFYLEISENAKPSDETDREDIIPEDDKYLVDGNTFTISIPVTEYNLMMGFSVSEGVCSVNRVRKGDRHIFTFKANTESVRLEYGNYMQLGDYLYTNGKWRPDIVGLDLSGNDDGDGEGESGNKNTGYGYGYDDGEEWNCIGVIFKVGPGNGDTVENYDGRLETIHGYAVALHDAALP